MQGCMHFGFLHAAIGKVDRDAMSHHTPLLATPKEQKSLIFFFELGTANRPSKTS